jgi:hypothetical protein
MNEEKEGILRPITILEIKAKLGNTSKEELKAISKDALKEIYEQIISILKDYVDMSEENYTIIALWIIGTYYHDSFLTYPYLFFNAMRGSAKTRTLRLIKHLAKNGDMLASLSEAVLFRTAGTLCIDEFERIDSKEKNALRELLNTAYKKGGCVKRMKKKHTQEGDCQVVESFDTFRPICMANISGMEEVLGDRCISLILEKSNNAKFTKKVEDYEWNEKFAKVFGETNSVVSVVKLLPEMYRDWNKYINYITTLTTLTTYNTLTTQTTPNLDYKEIPQFPEEIEVFFRKLNETEIDGRNLELFFPLIIIAQEIDMLDSFLEIVKKIINSKKVDDIIESKDVSLYSFTAQQDSEWHNVKELTNNFRTFIGEEQTEDTWLNAKWMGRALKRLNLILEKRRVKEGISVILNIQKAQTKLKIFQ